MTVRLDPKLRYFAEIAARKHRRTLSSFIEWAIELSLAHVHLRENTDFNETIALRDEVPKLWDVDEPDRFVKLALNHAELLTHEEQILWKLLRDNGLMWRGSFDARTLEWTWSVKESSINEEALRAHWAVFQAVAAGTKPRTALPVWVRRKKVPEKSSPPSKTASDFSADPDDEIPF
ncbi:MAG: hypothetical protein ACKVRO_12470 [Micropepsaceae bacterium]